ncbi:glycosyltransferase family protein [Saccharopolyspora hattusasensis]|uniref:glycosyltransferase family protein n=1 Tax=Saccharopolyspora hattusasensis TaxID=1128679 RepID=UPI003D959711
MFLQTNRDLLEAGTDLRSRYRWDTGLPEIDVLVLEWRWPIPGRNTTPCGWPGHTCDLHRQQQLVEHYSHRGIRTILWDKDQQLPADDPLRACPVVRVCEPALYPSAGAHSLLFPVADTVLDTADPAELAAGHRPWPLVYVGNQYGRDDAFDTYFAPAAAEHPHRVAGKWTDTRRWPHVRFTGRIPFHEVTRLYRSALSTVLLLPPRYAASGQMTQRIFEAVLAGCLPLAPDTIRGIDRYVPSAMHVTSGRHAADRIKQLRSAGTARRADLLAACLEKLEIFRLHHQLDRLHTLLRRPDPTPVDLPR